MSETLFRGKRMDTKDWIYGIPARFRGWDNAVHTCIIPEIDGKHVMNETVEVDPYTVGQYTGRKDCNGNRIFDGDICAVRYRFYCHSEFLVLSRNGAWELKNKNGIYYIPLYEPLDMDIGVIGNIYDNPELMMGGTP